MSLEERVLGLAAAREREAAALRASTPAEAAARLEEEARSAERRVAGLEEGRAAPCAACLEALELGPRLRWLAEVSASLAGSAPQDPLGFVEEELDWTERSAREVARWDPALAPEAREVLEVAAAQRSSLLRRRHERLTGAREAPSPGSPLEAALEAWLKAGECFRLEAELERERPEAPHGAEPPPPLEPLQARRAAWLEAAREGLAAAAPGEALGLARRMA
ncbi:MAG: hypothetical protein HY721_02935, partial [Planctomycetes bacterium]|nr:hypothetical protein [Planctomycetota bacterium]